MAERRNATETYVQTQLGLYVPKSLYDANTILAATTDDTPAALTVPASTFVGRKATGNIAAMTAQEAVELFNMAHVPITTSATSTQTVQASATTAVTFPSITWDGATKIVLTAYTQRLAVLIAGVGVVSGLIDLWEDTTDVGIIGRTTAVGGTGANVGSTVTAQKIFTPAAGAKVYTLRIWINLAGTVMMEANASFAAFGRIQRFGA